MRMVFILLVSMLLAVSTSRYVGICGGSAPTRDICLNSCTCMWDPNANLCVEDCDVGETCETTTAIMCYDFSIVLLSVFCCVTGLTLIACVLGGIIACVILFYSALCAAGNSLFEKKTSYGTNTMLQDGLDSQDC